HHRNGHDCERQCGPHNSACTESRSRKIFAEKQTIDGSTDQIYEKSKTENSKNNGRYTREIVNCDTDAAHKNTLLRVFPKIDCCKHTKRCHGNAKQKSHYESTEYRWEDSTFSICFPRLGAQKHPESFQCKSDSSSKAQLIWIIKLNNLADLQVLVFTR